MDMLCKSGNGGIEKVDGYGNGNWKWKLEMEVGNENWKWRNKKRDAQTKMEK